MVRLSAPKTPGLVVRLAGEREPLPPARPAQAYAKPVTASWST